MLKFKDSFINKKNLIIPFTFYKCSPSNLVSTIKTKSLKIVCFKLLFYCFYTLMWLKIGKEIFILNFFLAWVYIKILFKVIILIFLYSIRVSYLITFISKYTIKSWIKKKFISALLYVLNWRSRKCNKYLMNVKYPWN